MKRFSEKFKSVTLEKNFSENSKWSLLPSFKYKQVPTSGRFLKNLIDIFREKFKYAEFCPKNAKFSHFGHIQFLKIRAIKYLLMQTIRKK